MNSPRLSEVYCPGCAKRLPIRNYGCPDCKWENTVGHRGRIWPLLNLMVSGETMNNVSPAFLRVLAKAAQNFKAPL